MPTPAQPKPQVLLVRLPEQQQVQGNQVLSQPQPNIQSQPKIILVRLADKQGNQVPVQHSEASVTSSTKPNSRILTGSARARKRVLSQVGPLHLSSKRRGRQRPQQKFTTTKIFSLLLHNQEEEEGICLFCNQEIERTSSQNSTENINQEKSELFSSFQFIFNTQQQIPDEDSFNLCNYCTEDLKSLTQVEKELQIITRKFESDRSELMKIILQNYLIKKTSEDKEEVDSNSAQESTLTMEHLQQCKFYEHL